MPFYNMCREVAHREDSVRPFHPLQVVLCFFLCLLVLSRLVWMQIHPYEAHVSAPVLSLLQQAQQQGFACHYLEEITQAIPANGLSAIYEGPLSGFYLWLLAGKCIWGEHFSLQELMRMNLWLIVGMCILVLLWMRVILGALLPASFFAVMLLFRNA